MRHGYAHTVAYTLLGFSQSWRLASSQLVAVFTCTCSLQDFVSTASTYGFLHAPRPVMSCDGV